MCGIAGLILPYGNISEQELSSRAKAMASIIAHRGPDDSGTWVDANVGIALGHRRLSIIDLSPEGHQPMASSGSGRYVISYNGEIYNFPDLRRELEGIGASFRGASDTEVLLAAIEHWGVNETLTRANGMFAFALWDREKRQLWLARDRLGQKPLYIGWAGSSFVFASELKAIAAVDGFSPEVDRNIVSLYMRHGYVPEPHCIWRGIQKLTPGTTICLGYESMRQGVIPPHEPFWRLRDVVLEKSQEPLADTTQTLDELNNLLLDATQHCMVSDVPLGAFLSGGVDSSTIVALMQAGSAKKVQTFSIGFHESQYNEADHAADVARHIGTNHTELYVRQRDAMKIIPDLPVLYDEPFADSSQIPTYLVSRMAREHVTVALSGDGGDEIFGGYNRYMWGQNIASAMKAMPLFVRHAFSYVARKVPVGVWDRLLSNMPQRYRYQHPGDKIHKLAGIMDAASPEQAYWRLTSLWQQPDRLVLDAHEPDTALSDPTLWPTLGNLSEKMMVLDCETYLPGDILTKVDRASMAVGLEVRVPLLDYRVIDFAWRMPLSMKIRNDESKWALRQILYRYVPRELIDRPKMGFGVPIDSWLRGELREWAEDLLSVNRMAADGIFDPILIQARWKEHLSGRRNWQHHLWAVLMFQAWAERGGAGSA